MNRISQLPILVLGLFALVLESTAIDKRKTMGVLLWNEEARYLTCMDSMMTQLKQNGFSVKELDIKAENALGNKAKAMKIAQDFSAEKRDIYVAIGASALDAMKNEIKDAPLVFGNVYDPVGSKFVKSLQSSENNITGMAFAIPLLPMMSRIKTIKPVKNMAVLYTIGQKNSESTLKNLQAIQDKCSITVLPVPVNNKEEALSALAFLKGKVDAIYLTGSTLISAVVPEIAAQAIHEKLITVTSQQDFVERGVLFGGGCDSKEQGQKTAEKILAVFKGEKPMNIPIDEPKKIEFYINIKTAKSSSLVIPEQLKKEATKLIE